MSKRILSLAGSVCLTAMVAAGQTSYIFQLVGLNGTTTSVVGLGDNDFSRALISAKALPGAFQVLATPDGKKVFIIAPGGIQSAPANATLTPLTAITGLSGTIDSAAITPDGKYLLVVSGDEVTNGHFYVIDTSNNNVVQIDAGVPANGAAPVGFAVSRDSQTAWVLSNTNGQSALGAVNLSSFQISQFLYLPYVATSVTLSPLGLLYVTFIADQIYEIDPFTLTVTTAGHIQIPSGQFGPLRFDPNGTTAYSPNSKVCALCASFLQLNVATHTATSWPPFPDGTQPTFDDIFVAGSSQVFAYCSACANNAAKLWDVTPSPLSAANSALGLFPGPGLPIFNILGIAMSNERPSARFLYLMISNGDLLRVNIAASNKDGQTSVNLQNGTALSFTPIPAQGPVSTIFNVNRNVTVLAGASSVPLVAQVLTAEGRPVIGVHVCFSAASSDLVINNPSPVTNADGWVQTTVTPSATAAGPYPVVLSAGAACPNPGVTSTTFTINVGAVTTGNSPMSIYTGDAQLLRQQSSTLPTQPLTVKLTNPDGTPIVGAQVSFAITQGSQSNPGFVRVLDDPNVGTDANGLFRVNFITGLVDQGSAHAFQTTTVTASSNFGSVDFLETTQNAAESDAGQPRVLLVTPEDGQLTLAQGDLLPAGITAKTTSGHAPASGEAIPNIGIRLADPDIVDQSTVVSCQGPSRGGADGVSICNVLAVCQPAGTTFPQTFGAIVAVGEYSFYPLHVTITQGRATRLSIAPGSPNNLTGNPQSSYTLSAKVTDSCNQSVNGVTVNWAVTQGSASLGQVQTVSQNGIVSARLTLGATPGPVQVTVSGASLSPVVFNFTNQVPVSGVSLVSGGGQSAIINQAFANPVVFVVRDTNNQPVPGLLVTFSVAGSATITSSSATTNAQGLVQTSVTAGATAGTITVTATYKSLTATATLSSHPPGPVVTVSSFVNAASLVPGMTPCGLVTVTGPGVAPTPGVFSGLNAFGPLPYTLGPDNATLTANNLPVPIEVVANQNGVQQINFQAPCELTPGTATIVITVKGASTTVPGVPVLAVQPGIFTYAGPNGKPYGAVIRAVDGSYVTPSNQARQGDRLYMVVTGLGQGTPAIITNSLGTGAQNVNLPIAVGVHDNGVPVLSARYFIGSIGAYLVEFTIPPDAPIGTDQSLAIAARVNDTTFVFGNSVFLPGVIAGP